MQLLKCAVGFHEVQLWDDAQTFILGGWRPLVVPILWPSLPKTMATPLAPQTVSPRTATDNLYKCNQHLNQGNITTSIFVSSDNKYCPESLLLSPSTSALWNEFTVSRQYVRLFVTNSFQLTKSKHCERNSVKMFHQVNTKTILITLIQQNITYCLSRFRLQVGSSRQDWLPVPEVSPHEGFDEKPKCWNSTPAVSYTHLTLPTNREV